MRKISFLCVCLLLLNFCALGQKKKAAPAPLPTPVLDTAFFKSLTYRNIGPTQGGRVTAVVGIQTLPGTFYMGATGGGVWKTEDYGITWANVSDGFFATPSIGDINVFQPNPKIVYVGTGSDGIRSNVIVGKGVYKSTDAGKTWKHVGLEKVGQIGAVEIHPTHADTVFVAAIGQPFNPNKERGVYRTRNGGKTWEQVLYLSDTIGAADLEFAPGNPDIVYATMWRAERKPWTIISGGKQAGGIYKSVDGGTTWKKLTQGLPNGLIGKIDLAVSDADPKRLYALIEAPKGERGIYRSDDQGENFKQVVDKKELIDRPFYYCNIEANPKNADILFAMTTSFWKSTDGGKTWKSVSTPHGDNHDLWINKRDTSIWIQSNDGGANVTTNSGKSWSSQNNQPTSELYQVDVDDQYPYWLYAGQQDNNTTVAVPTLPPYDPAWGPASFLMATGGCETGPAVPKPGNHNIIYANCKGRFSVYDKSTGQEQIFVVGGANMYGHDPDQLKFRFQRVSPIHVSPHNPNVVYHTSQYVHKTMNDGMTWEIISPDLTANEPSRQIISGSPITRDITGEEFYSTIYDIKESSLKAGLIWVGANDGPVHVTQDGGKTWTNVTPKELPPGGRIDCVEPSPHTEGKAYFVSLRYQLGGWKPYIYKTLDFGKTWNLITNGIPSDFPVRVVREDPGAPGVLYAGTEYGMFISLDDGASWQRFQQNLPVTPITDIKVYRNDLVLSTMGRSFWVIDNITPLHQLAKAKQQTAYLFKPADTYAYRYRGNGRGEVPYFPAPSAIIDYYLKAKPATDIKLEILSGTKVIRSFTSAVPPRDTTNAATRNMATNFTSRNTRADLTKNSGANRFRWDMTHEGPWDSDPARNKRGGHRVSPGTYEVRLTVDQQVFSQPLVILADPRVKGKVSTEDMKAQEQLVFEVNVVLDSTKRVADKIKKQRKEIASLVKAGKASDSQVALDRSLLRIEDLLVTKEGAYETPRLIDQLNYLRQQLDQADQRPGRDLYQRYDELKAEAWKVLGEYRAAVKQ
ncbi:MAG: hypothetical protein JNL40_15510 [Cyclobacteriaceae bacterium]|nr:hypothetical protein [Cyclobacteriaceae bacterium]